MTTGMEGKKVVLELVVCWEGGAVLIRSTFQVWDIEFYLNKHVSYIIVEQHWWQFPGCFLRVLYVEINSILTQVNSLWCVNVLFNQESRWWWYFHMKPGYFLIQGSVK